VIYLAFLYTCSQPKLVAKHACLGYLTKVSLHSVKSCIGWSLKAELRDRLGSTILGQAATFFF
jgi:hypothetical protein